MAKAPTLTEKKRVNALVDHFVQHKNLVSTFQKQVLVAIKESSALQKLEHLTKDRVKDPKHLRDKLFRKMK